MNNIHLNKSKTLGLLNKQKNSHILSQTIFGITHKSTPGVKSLQSVRYESETVL